MNILLVYPQYPVTFWSFKYALKFIAKKASLPPLGLLTVAAMLPREWNQRLVDLNTAKLTDADLRWADYVLLSAMSIQKEFADAVIERCRRLGTKVIAGGPLFTAHAEDYGHVDHLILNEAEITLPLVPRRPGAGQTAARVYLPALGGPQQDAAAALRPPEHEALRLHEHPVFPRLPL